LESTGGSVLARAEAIGHITRFFGNHMQVDVSDDTVKQYQSLRLKEGAAPKSINEEVGFLLRLLNERGDAIRYKMRRGKTLRLKLPTSIAKAYDPTEKAALLRSANVGASQSPEGAMHKLAGTRSPFIKPALSLAFNTGMRNAEIRNLTWEQVDLEKGIITVGRSKTDAGEGRTIPPNSELHSVLTEYVVWYTRVFGTPKPQWYVFPSRPRKPKGIPRPCDPTRPITTLKTSWNNVRNRAGAKGRFHDTRHTLITELAESGAGDQTIMDIAGHVSRQMLARYSHIRMEAKRKALEAIKTKAAPALDTEQS
jgi:integrase